MEVKPKYFFFILFCIVLYAQRVHSQSLKNQIVSFSFDACTVKDDLQKSQEASVGALNCICGPSGQAVQWSGGLNFAEWQSQELTSVLAGDFSFGFYFKPDLVTGTMDILSKRDNCGLDSFFAIRYVADQKTIIAELIERVDNLGTLKAVLPANLCWYHIAFTKAGNRLTLYVNGEEKDFKVNNYIISVINKAKLNLANSPCLAVSDRRFQGGLDELKVFNRALSKDEVRSLYTPVDKLKTKDTVLLKGQSVQIRAYKSCATSFSWSPTVGVQNKSTFTTLITPQVTTTYSVSSTQGSCILSDSIKITVVDAAALDCSKVQLPNAFTPNQDGLNDLFRVSNPYVLPGQLIFNVFDRWGEKVFSGSEPTSAWDGTFRGKPVNPGLFVYHLKYNCSGKTIHKSGSFNLIR